MILIKENGSSLFVFQKIARLFSKKIMQISERLLAVYMKKEYTMSVLEIKNLHVSVEDKEILKGLNLTLKTGEIAAIMVLTELVNLPLSCYYG